jgi:hypothetical protein
MKVIPSCSICRGPLYAGNPQWKGGNNAQPVNDGRCCDDCNAMFVVPARIANMREDKEDPCTQS